MDVLAFIKSNNVVNNSSVLMLGTLISQLVVILVSPILTRMYSPEDFGVFSVYVAIVTFFTVISNLRYELAIPLSKSLTVTLSIAKLSLLLIALFSVLFGVFLYASDGYFLGLMNSSVLHDFFWLLPVGVFIGGVYSLFSFWSLKKKNFLQLAVSRALRGGFLAVFQVIFGLFNFNFLGMILGHLLGFFVATFFLLKKSIHPHIFAITGIKNKIIKSTVIRYKKFPKYSTFSEAMVVFGSQFPVIFFASFFSIGVSGFYMLASRVISAPVALIAEAIGKAFLIESIDNDSHKLKKTVFSIYSMLLKISLGPFLIFAIVAPNVFIVVFGDQWTDSGLYVQAMIPWILAVFIFVPMMQLYVTLEQQDIELRFQAIILTSRLSGILIGAFMGDVMTAIVLYSFFAFTSYAACGLWIIKKSGVNMKALVLHSFKEIILVLIIVLPLFVIKTLYFSVENLPLSQHLILFLISILLIGLFVYRSKDSISFARKGL
jgi:O-antigen/teichoic acid export membrane protein